jgi:glycosyltransferase involved in cell wall biosynthesis
VEPQEKKRDAILMVAYTHYSTDPRVMREAEVAVRSGFEVDVLVLRRDTEPAQENVRGVNVLHLNQRRYRGKKHFNYFLAYLLFFIRVSLKIVLLHCRRPYRIIHVNNMPDFLVFSTLFAKLSGAKIILDIHDPMPDTFAWKFRGGHKGFLYKCLLWQEQLSARFSDAVVTVSDPVKYGILVKHGIPDESICVAANFADDELFALRSTPELDGTVKMIFHGTILERYGLKDLIEALAKVKRRSSISVRIIGEGDFAAELKKLIRDLELEEMVYFENKLYPLVEIPEIVSQFHVGLAPLQMSPSTNYGLPSKVIEYLALGMPVITVPNTAISFYLKPGDCLFYEPGNVEQLALILNRIAENPSELTPYRERARQIRHKFLWSHESMRYVQLLKDLAWKKVGTRRPVDAQEGVESAIISTHDSKA